SRRGRAQFPVLFARNGERNRVRDEKSGRSGAFEVGGVGWWRGACDGENLLDATCPLLLQASVKLYGIGGHVVLLLTFVVEGGARSGSSPSASAQYISASFRHWRLCRGDFATAARRANFSALAR